MNKAKRFEDLIVWQKAHQLVLAVYAMTSSFPQSELYGITSQIRRAAISIPSNIAEGFKRIGTLDKIRFYNIAQGSLEETKYLLILSNDLKYSNTKEQVLQTEEVGKLLNGLIKSIKSNS